MKFKFWNRSIVKSQSFESSKYPNYPFFMQDREDVIFIHVPKTAGTSIRFSFKFNSENKSKGFRKHNDVNKVISLIGFSDFMKCFKFTFVRNPWDRLLSHYYFALRKGRIIDLDHQYSFKKWAISIFNSDDLTSKIRFNNQPQVDWLKYDGEVQDFNFIGRYENLEDDYKKLVEMLSTNAILECRNINPLRLNYKEHFDSELKKLVSVFYEEDIDTFKYVY